MVLAARAMAKESASLKLDVNGTPQTGALYKLFDEGELAKPYRVRNLNANPLRAVIAAGLLGLLLAAAGLSVRRTYRSRDR